MTRFAWLQARTQLLTGAACLLVAAIVAAVTGPQLAHIYATDVVPCAPHGDCSLQLQALFSHDGFLQNAFNFVIRLVPGLIGIFWGAPLLARELETGTFRVAWTQSVTRSRWLATKLALGGLASMAAAGLFSLTVTWWFRSFDLANGDLHSFSLFDQRDLVAVGYALFAFALGALAGAMLRRVLPAMATTLGVFVFARVALDLWVRPHFMPALHKTASLLGAGFGIMSSHGSTPTFVAQPGDMGNDWVLKSQIVDSTGHPVSASARTAFLQQHCPAIWHNLSGPPPGTAVAGHHGVKVGPAPAPFQQCQTQAARVYHLLVTYQPSSRFWPFQWIETGVFTALALATFAACFWWIKRRIS